MAKLAVNRDTVNVGGKEYRRGDTIDHDPENREHRNLLYSGKLILPPAKNIDEKLAREGDTLTEQLAVNRAEAESVIAGPAVSTETAAPTVPGKATKSAKAASKKKAKP